MQLFGDYRQGPSLALKHRFLNCFIRSWLFIIRRLAMKGICHDCKVRNNDVTEKDVTICHLCEEYFCDYHINPKIVVLSPTDLERMMEDDDYKNKIKAREILPVSKEEMERNDGHPCMPYTHYKYDEMDLETRRLYELFERWTESRGKKPANLKISYHAFLATLVIIILLWFALMLSHR
jgi:hypothetical protein